MKTMQKQSYNFYRITQLLQRYFIREEAGCLVSKSKGNLRRSLFSKNYGFFNLKKFLVGWKAFFVIKSKRRRKIFKKKSAGLTGGQKGIKGLRSNWNMIRI